MSTWDIYWLTRMDSIHHFFAGMFAIFLFCFCLGLCIHLIEEQFTKFQVWTVGIITLLCSFGLVLTPTTNEMAAIMIIPKIANNEDIQGVGSEIVSLAKDWLKELHPKEKAEKDLK